ncbi:hypothetical protein F5Y16DRAFT_395254 [Xylariaceae sp. FL0255]|nr:hypothetical protein F5Y16DRAFT_395254 [Xylariaceae sp. FL0255]
MESQPQCTHACLARIAGGDHDTDSGCPNFTKHKSVGKKIKASDLLQSIAKQLSTASTENVMALKEGSTGSLFKVRVPLELGHYTVIAKCFQEEDLSRFEKEKGIYDHLQRIQGQYVPVCIGKEKLDPPFRYHDRQLVSFLALSWSGEPLDLEGLSTPKNITDLARQALSEVHKGGVLHCDTVLRNLLYKSGENRVMIVDFEESQKTTEQRRFDDEVNNMVDRVGRRFGLSR